MLTIRFSSPSDPADPLLYRVHLDSPAVGQASGALRLPFDVATQRALQQALATHFRLDAADASVRHALQPFGPLAQLPTTVGAALAQALLAEPTLASHFDSALHLAMRQRQPLPVKLRFGEGCDSVAALPWELLHYRGRFLVADSSIALARYPEGLLPPTPALTPLPLRVLLVLSEPLDAGPIQPHQARDELRHGLQRLDEQGAVIVDELRPPTFQTLTEAVTTGEYHLLVFYGHGVYQAGQGHLLFEDEFGGQSLVRADALGALVRNSSIRLVLLGACESAAVREESGLSQTAPNIWSGTAPALVRAGVPLAVGMQVTIRVDAALAFLRQFALSLAAGKSVIAAVSDARKPLIEGKYQHAWFIPALYGRPLDDYRLFDAAQPLPSATAVVRQQMQTHRRAIERLEAVVAKLGMLDKPGEIAMLRAAKRQFAQAHAELARRTPGGYAPITSPLYGVPSNPVFVGRQQSLLRAGQALKRAQPVVLWGLGGIGKSALAIEMAHRQGWRFGGGVLWLDCRGGPAFDTLLDRLAAFCGIEAPEQIPPAQKMPTVRAALANLGEPVLLIWDNVEDMWDNRDVRHFLHNRPINVQVLLTTREKPEELAWTIIELTRLDDQPMTALFLLLAERAGVKVPTVVEANLIPQIIIWLQGHPLALILIIPLAAKRGLARVWQDLQAHPLKGIEAAFAVSYERLTADQQRLFMRLSVFTIPFTYEAAVALLPAADQTSTDAVDELLDTLVQRALIQFDGAHYAYHALLRQYAYALLMKSEDVHAIHGLAADYLRAKDPVTPNEGLEEVDQWEKSASWETFAHRTCLLIGSLDRQGYWTEIEARLGRAQQQVKAHGTVQSRLYAELLNAQAGVVHKSGHWDQAIALYQQSLQILEDIGDHHAIAQTRVNLGLSYIDKGDWNKAIDLFEQAQQTFTELDDHLALAKICNSLGSIYARKGELDKAIDLYEQARQTFKELNEQHDLGQALGNLGNAYRDKKEWDTANDFYNQDLQICIQLGDIHGQALTFSNLGLLYYCKAGKDDADKAITFYQRALPIFEQINDIRGKANTYANLGLVYKDKGNWSKAIELYQQAQDTFEQLGDLLSIAQILGDWGLLYRDQGNAKQAIHHTARAYILFHQLGAGEMQKAANALVKLLGSVEAANHYLVQMGSEARVAIPEQPEDSGVTLDQLLTDITKACQGDTALAAQLTPWLQALATDPTQPTELQNLARVLTAILAGARVPNLRSLPPHLIDPIQALLATLVQ